MIAVSFLGLLVSAALLGTSSPNPIGQLNATDALTPNVTTSTNALIAASIKNDLTNSEAPLSDAVITEPPTSLAPIDWDAFFEKVKQEDAKLPSNEEMMKSIKKQMETINRDFIPYRALHQTWGLKGMTPETYQTEVFIPYFNNLSSGHVFMPETLPRGMRYRLVVLKDGYSEDMTFIMSPRNYARLCDQPENHDWANCNYFTHVCEKVCHYNIWHNDYNSFPRRFTKTIVFDEMREFIIKNYDLQDRLPKKPSPTYVDPVYEQDNLDDGMDGEDVQILAN